MSKNLLENIFHSAEPLSQDELNAYLADDPSSKLRHKVERFMIDDPLLSDAVEGYEEMEMNTLPSFENFSDFKKKLPHEPGAKIRYLSPAKILMRVAAVAVVLLIAITGYFALQNDTDQRLFSDFYAVYQNDISLTRRGEADGLQRDFKNALGNYVSKNYDAALLDFEKAIKAEPENDAARFFAGLACMELNQMDDALVYLTPVKNNRGNYARKAHWYAILATIKTGDTGSAKVMLDELIEEAGYKKKKRKD